MSNSTRRTYRGTSPQRQVRATRKVPKKGSKSPKRNESPELDNGVLGDPDGHMTRLLATQSYITEVKSTFIKKPDVYRKFALLLCKLREPSSNAASVIQEIVKLFEGYPHLIGGLNGFLPPNCELRTQQDAVVVKVHGESETRTEVVMRRATDKAGHAIDYINDVKVTLGEDSRKYREFLKVLQEYHHSERGNKTTIRRVIKLLREYPSLVKGFNAFLPEGYSIEVDKDKICRINDRTGEISTVMLSQPKGTIKLGRDVK